MVLRAKNYGTPSDIFAAGCVMAELITGRPLFPGGSEYDQLDTIFKILGTPTQLGWREGHKLAQKREIKLEEMNYKKTKLSTIFTKVSLQAVKILKKMLQINPARRPTAE
jgi:serine/threonine protein kinase